VLVLVATRNAAVPLQRDVRKVQTGGVMTAERDSFQMRRFEVLTGFYVSTPLVLLFLWQ